MARADYFDRAIQAAFHVLDGLDNDSFLEKIDNHPVAVAFDCDVQTAEGDAAVDLTLRLLARFYPKIAIIPLDATAQAIAPKYTRLACAINQNIEILETTVQVEDIIVVGKTPIATTGGVSPIYIGSDGWVAKLSCHEPVGSMASNNPFGAGIAACLAAANLFRHVFIAAPLDDVINISVLDLDPQVSEPLNPALGTVDLGQVFLVGAGAVGNGFLWAISRCLDLRGQLYVIDHQPVDLFNIQRYIMTERQDEDVSKVQKAANVFEQHPGIQVTPIPHTWEEFLSTLPAGEWIFDKVVSALDTPGDRINLQASLPKWIVNAWTGTGDAGISYHDFKNHACMACLYMPVKQGLNEDEVIAQALGFPQDLKTLLDLRKKIETGWLVDKPFLQRISTAKAIHFKKLLPFKGQTLRSLYSKGVCSGMVMELAKGPVTERAEVPMPFQSALAGILQAAVLVAYAGGCLRLPAITRLNLMKPFPQTGRTGWNPAKNPRCFCGDSDFQEVYSEKYERNESS